MTLGYDVPAITIRNIPRQTLDGLHRRAHGHHRSLNGEILVLFERFVFPSQYPKQTEREEGQSQKAGNRRDRLLALAGSWKDSRSHDDIMADIVSARTMGREVCL